MGPYISYKFVKLVTVQVIKIQKYKNKKNVLINRTRFNCTKMPYHKCISDTQHSSMAQSSGVAILFLS